MYGSVGRLQLGYPRTAFLSGELERIKEEAIFEQRVFLIRNLGFITPTEARRISFEETVRFEKIHEETYRDFGFELISIEPKKAGTTGQSGCFFSVRDSHVRTLPDSLGPGR